MPVPHLLRDLVKFNSAQKHEKPYCTVPYNHWTPQTRLVDQKGLTPEPNVAQIKDTEAQAWITNIFLQWKKKYIQCWTMLRHHLHIKAPKIEVTSTGRVKSSPPLPKRQYKHYQPKMEHPGEHHIDGLSTPGNSSPDKILKGKPKQNLEIFTG